MTQLTKTIKMNDNLTTFLLQIQSLSSVMNYDDIYYTSMAILKLILEIDLAEFDSVLLECPINRITYNMSKLENTNAPKQIKKRK